MSTTIKVSTDVRDRVNAAASDAGVTAGALIGRLLDDYEWRRQVEAAKRAMRDASAQDWAEYAAEFAAWDVPDGLEAHPW